MCHPSRATLRRATASDIRMPSAREGSERGKDAIHREGGARSGAVRLIVLEAVFPLLGPRSFPERPVRGVDPIHFLHQEPVPLDGGERWARGVH